MDDNYITRISDSQELLKQFAAERGWKDVPNIDKFDHLHEELLEMSQYLRYKTEEERIAYILDHKEIFLDGIGDLYFGLCRLANQLGVDIEEAFNDVYPKIFAKFPVNSSENNRDNKKKSL